MTSLRDFIGSDPRADINAREVLINTTATNGYIAIPAGVDAVTANAEYGFGATTATDVRFNGATAGRDVLFDASADTLFVLDNTILAVGTGSDLTVSSGGVNVAVAAPNGTLDVQGSGTVTIDSSAGAITIGGDADAQAVNLGTGAAARVITIGNAASASCAIEAGVGSLALTSDLGTAVAGGLRVNPTAIVPDVTGGSPVTVADNRSFSAYIADTTGGNITYTLPATASMVGRRFLFFKGVAANNMLVTAAGAVLQGAVHENDIDVEAAGSTTGTFTAGAIGDYLEVWGLSATVIFCRGQAAGATFAWS